MAMTMAMTTTMTMVLTADPRVSSSCVSCVPPLVLSRSQSFRGTTPKPAQALCSSRPLGPRFHRLWLRRRLLQCWSTKMAVCAQIRATFHHLSSPATEIATTEARSPYTVIAHSGMTVPIAVEGVCHHRRRLDCRLWLRCQLIRHVRLPILADFLYSRHLQNIWQLCLCQY